MANTFDWIEIRTNDIGKSAAFYRAVFGWEVTDREKAEGEDVWIFDTGSEPRTQNLRRGGIWLRPKGDALGLVVYIVVDDIETTLARIESLGGKVVHPKNPVGSGFAAYFTDPDGNLVGLYEDRQKA